MRIVLDTNIIVAAVRSPTGASAEVLRRIRARRATMLASIPLFIEYEAVLTRPAHVEAAGLTRIDVELVLDALAALVEPVDIAYLWRPQLRDVGDDMVIEAAINGRAQAIVTFNMADFGTVPSRFGIEVVVPSGLLRRL